MYKSTHSINTDIDTHNIVWALLKTGLMSGRTSLTNIYIILKDEWWGLAGSCTLNTTLMYLMGAIIYWFIMEFCILNLAFHRTYEPSEVTTGLESIK